MRRKASTSARTISATSPYNRLRDARSEARDAERGQDAGEADARDPAPLWRTVRELALKTLTETTKDLEVAAWVTEALVRSHGLAGLTAGAQADGGPGRDATGTACSRCPTITAWRRASRRSPG